jgi:streptogramin lyase
LLSVSTAGVMVASGCGSGNPGAPVDAGTMDSGLDPRYTVFQTPTAGSGPWMITPGPDGNLWFTEQGPSTSDIHKIGRATLSGEITEFDLPAGSLPSGITAGPDGAIWFTDYTGQMIGRITTDGRLSEFPLAMPGGPVSIVTGPDGNLWFTVTTTTDTAHPTGNIERMTPAGEVTLFPLGTQPNQIAVGPDGNLWYVAWYDTAIGQMTPAGVVTEFPLPASSFPHGLVAGPDGNMWITEANGVGRLSLTGVHTPFAIPPSAKDPTGFAGEYGQITVGADGALWFAEDTGGAVGRSTVDGVVTDVSLPYPASLVGIALASDGSLWLTDPLNNTIVRFRP